MTYTAGEKALYLSITAGTALVIVIIALNCNCGSIQKTHYIDLYSVMEEYLPEAAINKAVIHVRSVPEFSPFYTGPPLCLSYVTSRNAADNLQNILADADIYGESRQRLTANEFLSISKMLCVSEEWVDDNEGRTIQWYPGMLTTESGKYWYGLEVYRNVTEPSIFKKVVLQPPEERLKVYIFPGHESYFEEPEGLLKDLQQIAHFEVAGGEYGAAPVGIYRGDYLVSPNAVDFYIDPEFRKPDGSSVIVQNLHPETRLGSGISIGSLGILHDYEYVQVPAIWFVTDSKYEGNIDASINEMRLLLKNHTSKCLTFKKIHDEPCP
jgi:hypothetical protein